MFLQLLAGRGADERGFVAWYSGGTNVELGQLADEDFDGLVDDSETVRVGYRVTVIEYGGGRYRAGGHYFCLRQFFEFCGFLFFTSRLFVRYFGFDSRDLRFLFYEEMYVVPILN